MRLHIGKAAGAWYERAAGTLHLDYLEIEPVGIVRLVGWCLDAELPADGFTLTQGGKTLPPTVLYRMARPDVAQAQAHRAGRMLCGFSAEFVQVLRPERFEYAVRNIRGMVADKDAKALGEVVPAYPALISTDDVLHRDNIYGFGPPADAVSPEAIELAMSLKPPVLDFGCGVGILVRELRARGVEAYGIELDRPPIAAGIRDDVRPYITLYDGKFPMPYGDDHFESAIASEVIEHVPDFEAALRDISRVTRSGFAITVPDISSVPLSWRHGVVPWHLLESTHVNFFNATSLRRVLAPHYRQIQLFKLWTVDVNGSQIPGSVAAKCEK
jgi:2-polyprenyl-3-methyl-5-hydroxy-6-metoxy-1,4-benzoquinol methylase